MFILWHKGAKEINSRFIDFDQKKHNFFCASVCTETSQKIGWYL